MPSAIGQARATTDEIRDSDRQGQPAAFTNLNEAALPRRQAGIFRLIGLGILSQAGVAIGLSLIIRNDFEQLARDHAEAFARLAESQPLMMTVTCIVFEIVGPILTKVALQKAGEIPADSGKPR